MPVPSSMEKPDIYVISRILERLWENEGPIGKTRLQVAARVNYDIFTRYVIWMEEKGLVQIEPMEDGHDGVHLTYEGEESYRKVVQWINEVIHGKM